VLGVSLRVSRGSSAQRSGSTALALLFVLERRLHLYHMHALDGGAVPLLLEPPFVVAYTPGAHNPPPARLALECFTVRPCCRCWSGGFSPLRSATLSPPPPPDVMPGQ